MIKTYLDSGVLISAYQGNDEISRKADEFITTEKSTKPLHRVTEITLISLAN